MTDFAALSDEQLLGLLRTEEDRLPRAAVDEFVHRGERMIAPLTGICNDLDAWMDSWAPVHATFILGALGGERVLDGLLAATHGSAEGRADEVVDALGALLGSIGPAALPRLRAQVLDAEKDEEVRVRALEGMAGAAARHPEARDAVLDEIRRLTEDEDLDPALRVESAVALLRFVRPSDRKLIGRWAKREEHSPAPRFDRDVVARFYEAGKPDLGSFLADWLDFYRDEELAARAVVRAEHDEDTRWAQAAWKEEPWLLKEIAGFKDRFAATLGDLSEAEREAALETADGMMKYLMEIEVRAPWRWDEEAADACLMEFFVEEWAGVADEALLRSIPGHMVRFVGFLHSEGRVDEAARVEIARVLEEDEAGFIQDVLAGPSVDEENPYVEETFEDEPEDDLPLPFVDFRPPAPAPRFTLIGNTPQPSEAPAKEGPAPPAGEPGRNSPCSCGSGKKYKRCCAP